MYICTGTVYIYIQQASLCTAAPESWTNSGHRAATSFHAKITALCHDHGRNILCWTQCHCSRMVSTIAGIHCALNSDSLCGGSRTRKKCVQAAPACTDRICALRGTAQCQSRVAGVFYLFSRPILWIVCPYFWCLCVTMFVLVLAAFGQLGGTSGIFLTFRVSHFAGNLESLWIGLGHC